MLITSVLGRACDGPDKTLALASVHVSWPGLTLETRATALANCGGNAAEPPVFEHYLPRNLLDSI